MEIVDLDSEKHVVIGRLEIKNENDVLLTHAKSEDISKTKIVRYGEKIGDGENIQTKPDVREQLESLQMNYGGEIVINHEYFR